MEFNDKSVCGTVGRGCSAVEVYARGLKYFRWKVRSMRIPEKQQPGVLKIVFGNVQVISKAAHNTGHTPGI